MRLPPLFLLAVLPCCGCTSAVGPLLGAEGASVLVFGRGLTDLGVSAISGRDCSVVRLEQGHPYCAPADEPATEPYCTRTLASVECWADPGLLPGRRRGIGDTPPPTLAQQRYQAARWPKSLFAE